MGKPIQGRVCLVAAAAAVGAQLIVPAVIDRAFWPCLRCGPEIKVAAVFIAGPGGPAISPPRAPPKAAHPPREMSRKKLAPPAIPFLLP